MHLRGATIYAKDLPRMKSFYRDVLGLRTIGATEIDNYVEFDAGTAMLALHAIPGPIAGNVEIASPPVPRENNPLKLIFEVEDVARERKRLEDLGVTIVERPWGACDGIDPEGNIFGLTSPS
jgi:catechol 2,3-dioxygenase-like lactoylglutathione lyase family enzyme